MAATPLKLKYNSATVHIDGLEVRSQGGEFDYALTACGALSRGYRFCTAKGTYTGAAEALAAAKALAKSLNKKLCKNCAAAAETHAAEEAAAAQAAEPARQLRPAQGESAVGGAWELLYDKPRQSAQVVRDRGSYALVCTKHLTVHRLAKLADERAVRKAGGWCPDC